MNNKVLLSVLGLLVLIFVSTNFFKKNNSKVILHTDLISIDSLKVNQIDIFNQKSDTLSIINDNDTWFVKCMGLKRDVDANKQRIYEFLTTFNVDD